MLTSFLFNSFRVERSSDQVIKPVNLEALTKWVGNIPEDVVHDMANIAPMLSVLGNFRKMFVTSLVLTLGLFIFALSGYDPYSNPPNYGNADDVVKENTNKVSCQKGFVL